MNLLNISNISISYDEETRKSLLGNGEGQVQTFLNEQLIDRNMSIDAPIKRTTINYEELLTMSLKQKRRNWYMPLLFWTKYENSYVLELNKQMIYLKRSSLMLPKVLPTMQIHSIIVANLIYWNVFPHVTTRVLLTPKPMMQQWS